MFEEGKDVDVWERVDKELVVFYAGKDAEVAVVVVSLHVDFGCDGLCLGEVNLGGIVLNQSAIALFIAFLIDLGDADGVIQFIDHDRPPQQRRYHITVNVIAFHERVRRSDNAFFTQHIFLCENGWCDSCQRDKSSSAVSVLFQESDQIPRRLFVLCDNVTQASAKRCLNRFGVFGRRADQIRHNAADPAVAEVHDPFDTLSETFIALSEIAQRCQPCLKLLILCRCFFARFVSFALLNG